MISLSDQISILSGKQNNFMKTIRRLYFLSAIGLLLMLAGCKEQIIHNLSEADVNRYLTRLHDDRIEGEKVKQADGRWALAVDKEDRVKAIKILEDSRLLRSVESVGNDKPSMISSREDQKFRHERALSREIENTLASVAGVLEARVHLNMAPTDPLFGTPVKNGKSSASVLIVAEEQFALKETDLAGLVAGASGIDKDAISVLINRNPQSHDAAVPGASETQRSGQQVPAVTNTDSQLGGSEEPQVESIHSWDTGMIMQVVASIFILLVGGVLLWRGKRNRKGAQVIDSPLLKMDDKK